jgi:predicted Zn-dependent peptidase
VDQLRSLQDNDGLARTLTHFQTIVGDWRYLTEYDRRIAAITPADVSDVVRRYLTAENRTVAVLKPKGQTP